MANDPKRGSALAKILRSVGAGDPEIEKAIVEYSGYWLGHLGGLRHIPAPALALLDSQKILLRGLLNIDRQTSGGGVDPEVLKLAVPVSNSLRLGEVRLAKMSEKGAGRKTGLDDIRERYRKLNIGGKKQ
jgi:hypothetical protein